MLGRKSAAAVLAALVATLLFLPAPAEAYIGPGAGFAPHLAFPDDVALFAPKNPG